MGRICHLEGQQRVKAPRGASRCVPGCGGEGLGQNSPPQRAADLRLSALTAMASTSRGSFGSPGAVGVSQSTTFETCSVRTQRQQRLEPRASRLGGLALISSLSVCFGHRRCCELRRWLGVSKASRCPGRAALTPGVEENQGRETRGHRTGVLDLP